MAFARCLRVGVAESGSRGQKRLMHRILDDRPTLHIVYKNLKPGKVRPWKFPHAIAGPRLTVSVGAEYNTHLPEARTIVRKMTETYGTLA